MKYKTAYLIFVVMLITIGVVFSVIWIFQQRHQKVLYTIPESIVALTDNYIIQKVGQNYFRTQYRRLPNKDWISTNSVEYIVTYEYLAASSLAGRSIEATIAYYPSTNVIRANYGVYDCVQDPSLCDFSLSKEAAIVAAKNHGLLGNESPETPVTAILTNGSTTSTITSKAGWYWEVSFPIKSDSDCFNTRMMYVHIPDGAVSRATEREACI